jgi:hypothetical protein
MTKTNYSLLTPVEASNLQKFAQLNGNTILVSRDSSIGQTHWAIRQDEFFETLKHGVVSSTIGVDITDYDSF